MRVRENLEPAFKLRADEGEVLRADEGELSEVGEPMRENSESAFQFESG
jgi:hypothetical protein